MSSVPSFSPIENGSLCFQLLHRDSGTSPDFEIKKSFCILYLALLLKKMGSLHLHSWIKCAGFYLLAVWLKKLRYLHMAFVLKLSLCLGSMSKNAESTTNKNGIFS